MATFWKTTIVFEVLSEGEGPPDMDLLELVRETIEGHMSGDEKSRESEKVSRGEMRTLLEAQRSDPEFLLGDDDQVLSAYEEASGNTVKENGDILDDSGRLVGRYNREMAENYLDYGNSP